MNNLDDLELEDIEMKIIRAFQAVQDEHDVWVTMSFTRGRNGRFHAYRRVQTKGNKHAP